MLDVLDGYLPQIISLCDNITLQKHYCTHLSESCGELTDQIPSYRLYAEAKIRVESRRITPITFMQKNLLNVSKEKPRDLV